MIAIDTNVLLRYLLADDETQSRKASTLINGSQSVLVIDVVLAETIWTLKGKKYKLDRDAIIRVINALFEEPNIHFEDGQTVWRALCDYRRARSVKSGGKRKLADFPNALIVNKAQSYARDCGERLSGVFTFDAAAQVLPGTRKP